MTQRLPPALFNARCRACWFLLAVFALIVASFYSLNLQWAQFLSLEALGKMGQFVGELLHPSLEPAFLRKLGFADRKSVCRERV